MLNRRRFSLSRFLMFAVAALVWAAYLPERDLFAVVFAATIALNGQEWYHDRFGSAGRLQRGWAVWSVGGRLVTIALAFTCVVMATMKLPLTGWGKSPGDPIFGFGFNPDSFAFEMAEFLRTAKIQGRVLNTTREQGDALVWRLPRAAELHRQPQPRVFRCTRRRVAGDAEGAEHRRRGGLETAAGQVRDQRRDHRRGKLAEDLPAPAAKSELDPFYDDGAVVMFGRTDAPAADLAFFRSHRLNADTLAFHSNPDGPSAREYTRTGNLARPDLPEQIPPRAPAAHDRRAPLAATSGGRGPAPSPAGCPTRRTA